MGPKAESLFHFTKSIEFLKGILENGFKPRYCLEDTRYLGIDYIAFPMSCFCDIPISRISEHTSFYGEYGIGMTRDWGSRNSLEPLIYAPNSGAVTDFINDLTSVELADKLPDIAEEYKIVLCKHFDRILCLTKPIKGEMLVGGEAVEKDFYQENEWRYVPKGYDLILHKNFEERRDKKNSEVETQALKFLPNDVKYIFVKSDYEIPIIFDFIQDNMGHLPLNEIKILCSRITSIETISSDV
ncbi:hypothetical protein KQ940_08325 [Marinobacterium sp. D7]|uniref:abortive infection system antitoxin AbiGi family protein n=1 Tax=Marinobacterium ramblicola TaxID=2849041 RepID=UPI001C2D9B00|nr:abortive infection system antitoxin AbiGi family protein [Marinobacterium ramblicola]MBV1788059.1 hypothetical protein [Marinobacterium ramblicola]